MRGHALHRHVCGAAARPRRMWRRVTTEPPRTCSLSAAPEASNAVDSKAQTSAAINFLLPEAKIKRGRGEEEETRWRVVSHLCLSWSSSCSSSGSTSYIQAPFDTFSHGAPGFAAKLRSESFACFPFTALILRFPSTHLGRKTAPDGKPPVFCSASPCWFSQVKTEVSGFPLMLFFFPNHKFTLQTLGSHEPQSTTSVRSNFFSFFFVFEEGCSDCTCPTSCCYIAVSPEEKAQQLQHWIGLD